jgi:hypothetical protein
MSKYHRESSDCIWPLFLCKFWHLTTPWLPEYDWSFFFCLYVKFVNPLQIVKYWQCMVLSTVLVLTISFSHIKKKKKLKNVFFSYNLNIHAKEEWTLMSRSWNSCGNLTDQEQSRLSWKRKNWKKCYIWI